MSISPGRGGEFEGFIDTGVNERVARARKQSYESKFDREAKMPGVLGKVVGRRKV